MKFDTHKQNRYNKTILWAQSVQKAPNQVSD